MPTPLATLSTLQVGTYNSVTDAFTQTLDLNDRLTYFIRPGGADLAQPAKVYARSSNMLAPGERIALAQYQNRHITVGLNLRATTTTGLIAACRALIQAIERPPYVLRLALPSSTQFSYADVVAVKHTIPSDPQQILAGAVVKVEIDFECRPGLRGDRLTLSNLVTNPGFEAPSGSGVQVFSDNFANTNAYTLGGSTSLSGGVLTLNANATAAFGSPEWGAINQWVIRFEYFAGTTGDFFLHRDASGNNYTQASLNGSTMTVNQNVAGTFHTLVSTPGATLADHTWYWLVMTQFPSAPGTAPDLQATLYNDSAGVRGSQIVTSGPVVCVDATAGLSGQPLIFASGGALNIGGATGGHTLSLFGPGGWLFGGLDSTTGLASGAWEQATANTYPGGAVTSYGAARIDVAPAGTLGAFWEPFAGGTPAGTSAIPVSPSQTLGLSAWVKSSGVGAGCVQSLQVLEFDASGAFLRVGTVASKTGPQASWTQLSGSYTTGVSCAYLSVRLEAADPTAGASANGTIWWDNAQCWNQTTTGAATMPYCELRFPQSPAQLVVTGLQGDMPSPALASVGGWISSLPLGYSAIMALGRRAQASANAQMVGPGYGYYGTASPPQATAVLDASSYGGFYATALVNPSWNPRAFSYAPSDLLGVFHLVNRFWTAEVNNLSTDVETRIITQQRTLAWWGLTTQADQLGAYDGPFTMPIQSSSVWSVVDSGEVKSPPLPFGAATDLTQNFLTPRPQWADTNAGGSTCRAGWQCLLPTDAETLIVQAINANNAPAAITNEYLWLYVDGLATQQGNAVGATFSLEATALPAPGHAGGGPGTSGTGVLAINSEASPFLWLDPLVSAAAVSMASGSVGNAAGGVGVNQFAGYIAVAPYDVAAADAAIVSMAVELRYSPLYLYPR